MPKVSILLLFYCPFPTRPPCERMFCIFFIRNAGAGAFSGRLRPFLVLLLNNYSTDLTDADSSFNSTWLSPTVARKLISQLPTSVSPRINTVSIDFCWQMRFCISRQRREYYYLDRRSSAGNVLIPLWFLHHVSLVNLCCFLFRIMWRALSMLRYSSE